MTELLIIKPSSLGDIVHALQVATSLKAQCKDLRISWIARDIFAPLVKASAAVDQVFVFERKGGTKGFLRMMREVRKTKFDYVFDMQGLLRTGLMASRALAKKVIGRTDCRELSGAFYDEKVPLPPGGRRSHAVDILLQFCPVLGAKPELRGNVKFREVDKLKPGFAADSDRLPPVVIFPDSRRAEKKWGGFLLLTQLLLRTNRRRRVIWAGNAHIPDKGNLPADRFLNLTGNTGLVALPALIQSADWVISNDSGPMHLAAALGVKTMGIFGPTDPRLYGPYPLTSPTNVVVQAPAGNLKMLQAKEVYARLQLADKRLTQ
ncbi:MAG: glycosyltransferase family 9 protein [Cephaloticoccus sp.]